jgi:phage-related protein
MEWQIRYFNYVVQEEIKSLPKTLLARYLRLTDLMLKYGANLGEPHTKALGSGLFELRIKGMEGIARIFYCTLLDKEIVVLHSFIKKTMAIPLREKLLATKRMKEVKNGSHLIA